MILQLHVIQGQPAGKTLVFGVGDYFLGRGEECHVRFNSDWVSRQHCQLKVTATGASLRDLGSRNGSLINGRRCTGEQKLQDEDHIQIGPMTFRVTLKSDPPPDVAEPPVIVSPEGDPPRERRMDDSTVHNPALGETQFGPQE